MNESQQHESDSASEPRGDQANQPAYGRRVRPEYGALASDLPAGYNPYLYGAPERNGGSTASHGSRTDPHGAASSRTPSPRSAPYGVGPRDGAPRDGAGRQASSHSTSEMNGPGPNGSGVDGTGRGGAPRQYHGIDLDDPASNPLYGHWDPYAIVAFVFALSSIPVLPAVMGGIAMWRTRTFRMKGFGLALAAVILNVLVTIVDVWMMLAGVSMDDLTQWLQQQSGLLGGEGGSGSVSA